MTEVEKIALDAWRDAEAWRIVNVYMPEDRSEAVRHATQHIEYRSLVRDDVRPPVVVDRAEKCWDDARQAQRGQRADDAAVHVIRQFGDQQFDEGRAEGERAGIERAIKYVKEYRPWLAEQMTRDLLGEQQ